ncbi:acetylserotonin O-methyltransferase [Streptomyces sp. ET3-23]|uniref:acetylserotonin O-methyltransferase n=1 Tax=Streptomyces sp. ET3-23 TaxID=2885643 RepID=UPI001D10E467|nr:acetylserotonin O-methyltransferase [Streptomyces sp. ET3-23]MCC2280412.1 acetylserotonin O-methyltransferase [Streptomyces sp. ET3-23]
MDPYVRTAGLDEADLAVVNDALSLVRSADARAVVRDLLPGLSEEEQEAVAAHCDVAHAAALVFPPSLDGLISGLRADGFIVGEAIPSVVVRERLSRRHGLPLAAPEVTILHVQTPAVGQRACEIELFVLEAVPGTELREIVGRERVERNESHLALEVRAPDGVVLAGLRALLADHGGLVADGGGYNSLENCTVLYFLCTAAGDRGGFSATGPVRSSRLEVRARGHHPAVLAAHRDAEPEDPARRLLELMTGAWTTQALAVAAGLGLADQLPGPSAADAVPGSVAELAGRLAVDPASLVRLLRYLAAVGVVAPAGDFYELTELGAVLREDSAHSMRSLALLYGGPFYRSFGELAHSVRTGEEAFKALFGKGHFDYFAERPGMAELFDSAMAASGAMFEPIPGLFDFSHARTVVDVAGGNGQLLGLVLAHAPHVRGVLLERAHVLEAAHRHLAGAGCADRCSFVAGDFTRAVPEGGDVYLLSRVLHDWDDEQCLAILRRCAESMHDDSQLLLVERLLPGAEEGKRGAATPLAVAWDLHMLCNVGGRERTADHYGHLLETAGFELLSVRGLPLEGNLLHARRRG